jgi:transposase
MGEDPRTSTKHEGRSEPSRAIGLPVLHAHTAGIDIGSTEHWVCCPPQPDGSVNVRRFGTRSCDLQELAEWLKAESIESVAMESTSVYWIPLYELLEAKGFEVLLANAKQLSNVPGRKTDMQDCQWIQLLHACGLLRGSFRPSEQICALRALMRESSNLIEERTRCVQRMQKALDQMNVQVHRAVSDITGTTGMGILRAIVAGERDPQVLAGLRDRRCRKSTREFAEYLRGTWREEHLFNLKMSLELYDKLNEMIDSYQQKIAELMQQLQPNDRRDAKPPEHPCPKKAKNLRARGQEDTRQALWRFSGVDLTRIDSISTSAANVVFTEVGLDLTDFLSEKHFVSWLRLSPNRQISGGKVLKKRRNAAGATRVANVLRMCATCLERSQSALGAQFRRLSRRKGRAVAIFAMARKLAILIYRMLRYGQDYVDQGVDAYEEQFLQRRIQVMISSAKQMGYEVTPIKATT